MNGAWALLAVLLLPTLASAQSAARSEFTFLGWNKACSVAFAAYDYGRVGDGSAGQPVAARIGNLTIAPGSQEAKVSWAKGWDGTLSWNEPSAEDAKAYLRGAGYTQPGFTETVRPDPVAPGRADLAELLLSSAAFRAPTASGWPKGPGWRLSSVHYSPLATCALLVYAKPGAGGALLQALLVRVDNPAARLDRARGHVTNARLLFDNGDAVGALAETGIAASLAPESPVALYHHAALLCLNGYLEEALVELTGAVRRAPRYAAQARADRDFDSLFEDRRFKALTGH